MVPGPTPGANRTIVCCSALSKPAPSETLSNVSSTPSAGCIGSPSMRMRTEQRSPAVPNMTASALKWATTVA